MVWFDENCVSLPGFDDVTDGSVDYFEMDWPVEDNGVNEEEMQRRALFCDGDDSDGDGDSDGCGCDGDGDGDGDGGEPSMPCIDNAPEQTDTQDYEVIPE